MSEEFPYCPICQLPLKAILISPDLHVSQCMGRCEENNEECPDGVECLSTDIFHYRDLSHKQLAAYRASADFVPPDIEIKPSKKRQTPRKSPKQAEPRKSRRKSHTPSKIVQKGSDSESDLEVLIPPKRVCKSLSFTKHCPSLKQTFSLSEKTLSTYGLNVEPNDTLKVQTEHSKFSVEAPRENRSENKSMVHVCERKIKVNGVQELTVGNVNLTSCEEGMLPVHSSRPPSSASSISISTAATSRVDDDSDHEYESTPGSVSPASTKPTINSLTSSFSLKKTLLKLTDISQRTACNLRNLQSQNMMNNLETLNKTAVQNHAQTCPSEFSSQVSNDVNDNGKGGNSLLPTAGHCDLMSSKAINKKGLQNKRSTLNSSSTRRSSKENDSSNNSLKIRNTVKNIVLKPSSPEEIFLPKNRKKDLLFTPSSSDSDLPLAVLSRNKTDDENRTQLCPSEFSSQGYNDKNENGINGSSSLPRAGQCDLTSPKAINKEGLQNKRSILNSSSTRRYSNENDSTDDSFEFWKTEEDIALMPSSPKEIFPPKSKKKNQLFSAPSSDSDLPLAVLARNKTADNSRDPFMVENERDGVPVQESNKTQNCYEPKGKMKGGKLLRTPRKTPTVLKKLLEKRMFTEDNRSDRDSVSLKSFVSKENSSYIPSDETSSHPSNSAVSTDELTPSSLYSSSYTSSSRTSSVELNTTDSSYSGSLEVCVRSRHMTTNSPAKNKNVLKPVLSQSDSNSGVSSSGISKMEAILFKRRKSPLKIKSPIKLFLKSAKCDSTDSDVAQCKSKWQTLIHKMRESSFPSDLKIDSEDSWTVPSSGSETSNTSAHLPLRQCPFYKRIPDTPFAVDAFQYWKIPGVKVYFLSHFHSDHYIGLKKSFAQPIYCSKVTANLVHMKLRVEERWLRVLELNSPQVICGVEVTALDANHCPGSFMFLFSLRNGKNYLHVGDFRASKTMTFHPSLQRISISKLFLDTTYCSPQYCFPTQEEVIGKVIDIVRNHVKNHPKTLVACGSYTIGKEKMFLGVAEALDWRVWARPEKQRVFTCLSDPRVSSRLVRDPRSANVHVLPMQSIQILPLRQHLQSCCGTFTHVIGVKPTGWELNQKSQQFKVTSRDNITVYGVPYSEHSSFTELRDFVQFLQPQDIVPTVNVGSAASREKMNKHFSEWLRPQDCKDKAVNQTKVSQFFKQSA